MTQYGTWVSYGGTARIELAIIMLAAAAGLSYAGARLSRPIRVARPGRPGVIVMILAWLLAIVAFLAGASVYVQQYRHDFAARGAPANPIAPVTFIAVGATFFIILVSSSGASRARLGGAVIGALAAPMIFEFPFDLVVMARTYPAILPDPAVYRVLFFLPLILIEVTTLSLLALTPMVRLSRSAFFSLASMLVVFAVWALVGFAYPSAPVPTALNVLSKILAFVTVLCLFLPQRSPASAPDTRASASTMVM